MKLVSRVTLVACCAYAFAFGAGCSSGDPPPATEDAASTLSEGLSRASRGGRRAGGRPGRPPRNPCAAVLCPTNTTCEVVRGDAVCTPIEPPAEPVFCGGIAAFECPGAGQCFDDPSDDCDPENGGADCGGVCDCSGVLLLCIQGTVFDDDPNVCACVPEEPEVDACATVRCAAGTHCEVVDGGAICAPDENPCNLVDCPPERPACEVQDGEAVCVPESGEGRFCGGIAGFECPGAGQCIDDPADDCDPDNGGADCGGICDCSGALVLCIEGTIFDEDPNVCACVPQENPCNLVDCPPDRPVCEVQDGEAVCVSSEQNPCAAVLCARGTHCEVRGSEGVCVPRHSGPCHSRGR